MTCLCEAEGGKANAKLSECGYKPKRSTHCLGPALLSRMSGWRVVVISRILIPGGNQVWTHVDGHFILYGLLQR